MTTVEGSEPQFLSFMLGQDMFAIGILAVREILEYAGVTPVPQMPACISGVINLRGTAVPVLDLACRLEREPVPVSKRTCIIVVEVDGSTGTAVPRRLITPLIQAGICGTGVTPAYSSISRTARIPIANMSWPSIKLRNCGSAPCTLLIIGPA